MNLLARLLVPVLCVVVASCTAPAEEPTPAGPCIAVVTLAPADTETGGLEPWSRYPDGSRLVRVDLSQPAATPVELTAGMAAAGGAEHSLDAEQLLFVGRERSEDPFAVWTCDRDGSSRQCAVRHPTDCGAAAFLPDGRIVYSAALPAPGPAPGLRSAWALFVAPGDGSQGERITFSAGADLDPTVLRDGRILYCGWQPSVTGSQETNVPGSGSFGLFTVHPDGTGVAPFHGHHTQPALKSAPHQASDGTLYFTARSADDPGRVHGTDWRAPYDGGFTLATPGDVSAVAPTADGRLLVSVSPADGAGGLYLLRRDGTVDLGPLLGDASTRVVHATEAAPRARPQGHLSMVKAAKPFGTLFCVDARATVDPDVAAAASSVRLTALSGPFAGGSRPDGTVLGVAPLAADGSFFAQVPPDVPLLLDLLDSAGDVVVAGATPFWVRPNESRGCVGCHEHPETSPPNRRPIAVTSDPVVLLFPRGKGAGR